MEPEYTSHPDSLQETDILPSSRLSLTQLPPGYTLRSGSGLDRAQLVKFMQRTYAELYPGCSVAHLAQTVEQYFSKDTPLWWVDAVSPSPDAISPDATSPDAPDAIDRVSTVPIACLWMGNVIDQVQGDRHAYIFLLYVLPNHRRRGIGAALIHHAEAWAMQRGDRQIGLHVFLHNQPALNLYEKLGYQPQSVWLVKPLNGNSAHFGF